MPNDAGADVALARIAYAVYAYHSLTLWDPFCRCIIPWDWVGFLDDSK